MHLQLLILMLVALAEPDPAPPGIRLDEVAGRAGLVFRFDAGSRGRHDLPEIMGGGVGLIDVDGDGRLDVYLCNGGPIGTGPDESPCRLFLNLGGWKFKDLTGTAHAPGPSYAMGVAVGDYDGDGRDDLFVSGWREQTLYRNEGGGRFLDVTRDAGLTSTDWGTSAAFADLDGDGDLDLYVATYLDYTLAQAPACRAPDGGADYCGPEDFEAQVDHLYRNNGNGTFTDVGHDAGIDLPEGRGLGVVVADLVGDRRPDVYVANDGTACRLFENKGNLKFEEVGAASGVAFDGSGTALAGMGTAVGDLDGDGLDDLAVSNFYGRSTVGFRSVGAGIFADSTAAIGLAAPTRGVNGFGLALEDFDGDGRLDLLQANGHVLDRARLGLPFAMRPTLLAGSGLGFVGRPTDGGPWFGRPILGRGLAVGDLDGDGRPDAVMASLDAPVALLRNASTPGRFAAIDLIPRGSVGARLTAHVGGRAVRRRVTAGGSYLSASSRVIAVGLGDAGQVDRLDVDWPDGLRESWGPIPAGETFRAVRGSGRR
ncbi:CRTAC1 family protein [Isosphaeraceae bacterium EP7]